MCVCLRACVSVSLHAHCVNISNPGLRISYFAATLRYCQNKCFFTFMTTISSTCQKTPSLSPETPSRTGKRGIYPKLSLLRFSHFQLLVTCRNFLYEIHYTGAQTYQRTALIRRGMRDSIPKSTLTFGFPSILLKLKKTLITLIFSLRAIRGLAEVLPIGKRDISLLLSDFEVFDR